MQIPVSLSKGICEIPVNVCSLSIGSMLQRSIMQFKECATKSLDRMLILLSLRNVSSVLQAKA